MFVRRYLRNWAGLVLALFALTCTDQPPTGPGRHGATSFDLSALLLTAPGDPPVPHDSVRITVRRATDELPFLDTTIAIAGLSGSGDSAKVRLDVELTHATEDVGITVAVIGNGTTWYTGSMTATLTAGATVTPSPLVLSYVGPGFDADSVRIQFGPGPLVGGGFRAVSASVWVPGGILTGVPVGFRIGNTALASISNQTVSSARVTASSPFRDSTWVYAETPTHLRDSARVYVIPPAAQLQKISGDLQPASPGIALAAPLVVRVLDALGSGFKGASVSWMVTAGTGQLSLATTTTDDTGYAAITVTPTTTPLAVQAAVSGLTGSPQTFTTAGTGGPANIVIVAGNGQSSPVGVSVPTAPRVRVTDAVANPLSGVPVTFAVTSGGGSITGASQTTDASGLATVGSWTLGTTSGTNTLTATVSGVTPATFTATGLAGPPVSIVIISGNGQTANAGSALTAPLVVETRDQFGNGTPVNPVTWTPSHGTVNPTSGPTNSAGRAQTTWTLGSGATTQTVTAAAGPLSAVFTATATFPSPSILLALVGGNRVPVPGTRNLQVTLSTPAPAGGLTVTVTSDNPSIVSVGTPGSVFIAQGQSTGVIALNGVGQGTTIVRGNAPGYLEGTLSVDASVQVLSMPTTLNVAFGGSASVPLTISSPAPAGGVTVNLVSSDPSLVSVATPTVTIPQGSTVANGTVNGVLPGTVTLTGTTANFGTAQSIVSTTANLNILETSATLNESFGTTVTVRFESQGIAQAAPSPGIPVTLTAGNPACLGVPPSVTIPTGLVQTAVSLSYGGTATTPCTTRLTASATNITPDSINATVNPRPAITLSAVTVGSGLQENTSGSLAAAAPNALLVRITSSDPAVLLVSPNASTPGSPFIDVPVGQGGSSFNYYVQGKEGATGTATITASNAAYSDGTATATLRGAALDIIFLGTTTTTLSANADFSVRVGVLNAAGGGFSAEQAVRAGGITATATVTSSAVAVGQLVTTAQTGASVTVAIAPGQSRSPGSVATGGVAFDPLAAGTTTVGATIPGYVALPAAQVTVTVSAPAITMGAVTVGSGLQENASGSLGASVAAGGAVVHLVSSDPAVFLVSPNASTPGAPSIDLPITAGSSSFSYYVQGVESATGTATVTGSITTYSDGTANVTVRGTALDIIFLGTTTTTLSADTPFSVRIGVLNAAGTGYTAEQTIRAGGTGVTATITSSAPAVGQLVTSAQTGALATVDIAPGQSRSPGSVATGGVAFDPVSAGSTTIAATITGYVALPTAQVTVTVSAPAITLGAVTVGAGLQENASGSLGAVAPAGGIVVHLTSSDPAVLRVSPNASTVGSAAVDVPIGQGASSFSYYVQGLEGATGTATITATIPAYTDGTATGTVRGSALDIIFLGTTTTTLSPDATFSVRIGVLNAAGTGYTAEQTIRTGGTAATATLTSSAAGVGQLVTSAQTGGTVTVAIGPGQSRSPGTVATGGVAFHPVAAGSTTVAATIPGFVALPGAQVTVTVSAPAITMGAVTVGAGLQESASGSMGAAAPTGGVQVHIASSNPSIALISLNASTPGSPAIDVPVNAGGSFFSYYVQGVEGASGTVTVTASAPGYSDGTATVTVRGTALDIIFLGTTTTTLSPDANFSVRIGVVNTAGTGYTAEQTIRAGGTAVTATLTSSAPTVGQLVTSAQTGATATVAIGPGQSRSPGTIATGGVAFDPQTVGSTTVAATIPGYVALPGAQVTVAVNAPVISLGDITVGAGLQESGSGSLGAAALTGGLTVHLASANPSIALVSPNASTAGSAAIDILVPQGQSFFTYYVQGVEGASGTVTVTATAPLYTDGSGTETVRGPALDIIFLPSTTTATAANISFAVRIGVPNALLTGFSAEQSLRAGGTAVSATLTSSNATVAQLVTTPVTGGSVVVGIVPGQSRSPGTVATGGVAFDPLTAGNTTVRAIMSGFLALPNATIPVTVNP